MKRETYSTSPLEEKEAGRREDDDQLEQQAVLGRVKQSHPGPLVRYLVVLGRGILTPPAPGRRRR